MPQPDDIPLGMRQKFVGCLVEMAAIYTWVGLLYGSLFFATVGQGVVFVGLLPQRSQWIAVLGPFLMIPLLIVFSLTYFNRSPFSPRTHCSCLLVAVGWYAAQTVVAELLILYDLVPSDSDRYGRTFAHVLMHLGWLS
jgi:hypothetical protein